MGTLTYETIPELVEVFDKHQDKIPDRGEHKSPALQRQWMNVDYISEVSALVETGWTEGIDDMLNMVDDLVETIDAEVDMPAWQSVQDVSGAEVNVADFLAGEPECMIDSQLTMVRQAGKVVQLVCPHGALSDKRLKDFKARGRYYVALVTVLQRAGYSVDLWIDNSCTNHVNKRQTARIHLMAPGDVLDIEKLNFWLAHPASTRAVGFALRRNDPDAYPAGICHRSGGGGYGTTAPALASDYDDGALLLDGSLGDHSNTYVSNRIKADLEALGITS